MSFRMGAIAFLALSAAAGSAAAKLPTFASNGIEIQVNRAVAPSDANNGNIVMSFVFTNTRDETLDLFAISGVQGISDAGLSYNSSVIAGIPICEAVDVKKFCLDEVEKGGWLPLSIDGKQSASITLTLHGKGRVGKTCSLDLSLPILVRQPSVGRAAATWRRITVGLPNIKLC